MHVRTRKSSKKFLKGYERAKNKLRPRLRYRTYTVSLAGDEQPPLFSRKSGSKLCLTSFSTSLRFYIFFLSIARNSIVHFAFEFFRFEIRTNMCGRLRLSSVRMRSLSLTHLRIFDRGNPLSLSVALSTQDPNFPKISCPKPKAAGLL